MVEPERQEVMDRTARGFKSGSTDALLGPIEMMRRVSQDLNLYRREAKAAGHKLEVLTQSLVVLTAVLVVLTAAVLWLTAQL